ncbi:MAG: glycosyltransferase family 2 protein [Candidatus Nealsonbacteria bacterium]|nr:glycosyltransferase family 2 protein [Candidatus Nealsonbacteria bacterium]
MKVSLVIPTRNEAKSLGRTIQEIPAGFVDEIIVSDGHSTDGTLETAKGLGCQAITQEGRGFGLGIISGIKHCTGDIIIIMDADGSQNPADIPRLIEKIKEGYDIGWGSRYVQKKKTADDTWLRYFGNQFFTFLTRILHGVKTADILYMFAAFKKEVFEKVSLRSPGFEFCIELPVKAHKAGFKFGEVPCVERKRLADETKVNDLLDGWKILSAILKRY